MQVSLAFRCRRLWTFKLQMATTCFLSVLRCRREFSRSIYRVRVSPGRPYTKGSAARLEPLSGNYWMCVIFNTTPWDCTPGKARTKSAIGQGFRLDDPFCLAGARNVRLLVCSSDTVRQALASFRIRTREH
ncbi:hypothetical protein F5141DRAFT_661192 [Pisolithus sp. B1]|nr:hypothetical protein F5141DRAFT_661192 [Pisolithus sp. B1]